MSTDPVRLARLVSVVIAFVTAVAGAGGQQRPATEISIVIRGASNGAPHYAVPDFVALSADARTVAAASAARGTRATRRSLSRPPRG